MHSNPWKRKFARLYAMAILCGGLTPTALLADSASKARVSGEQPNKLDAPKPALTERELWLLSRIEHLEERVIELENKIHSREAVTDSIPAERTSPPVSALSSGLPSEAI